MTEIMREMLRACNKALYCSLSRYYHANEVMEVRSERKSLWSKARIAPLKIDHTLRGKRCRERS